MDAYLFPPLTAGDEIEGVSITEPDRGVERSTYTPTLNATGGSPALGASGFLTGKWKRDGLWLRVIADLNLSGAGVSLVGSSWRIQLPAYLVDTTWHTAGPLDAASDIIGSFTTRSGTGTQTVSGAVLLCGPNGSDTDVSASAYMIFYDGASNSSIGSSNFTTSGRIKARAKVLIQSGQF